MLTIFNKPSATLLNWCLSPTQQSIGELWSNQSQYPVEIIDSTTGELKFTEQSAPTDLFVLTPTGFQPVKHIHKTIPYDVWELRVQDCEPLLCADTHIVLNADGIERYVKDLQVGELINTQFGPKPVIGCSLSTLPSSTMFDLELVDANHVYYTNNILSHNSETSCAYLFWFSIFNKDKTVLITSNKHKNSSEMISRIKYMYESLPDFLKPGVTDDGWNKLSLKFETGSRIISDATSETTGRGGSFSILYCLGGGTTVTVRNKNTGEVSVVSLQELYHTTSGSRRDAFSTNEDYEILTPHSWVDFAGILQTQDKELFRISLSDGTHIDATPEHSFFSNGERIQTQMLQVGQHIDTTAAQLSIESIQSIGKAAVYDIVEVNNDDHSFLVNGNIVTKNCDETAFVRPMIQTEFWASISPTLATGGKLFMTSTPNGDSDLFATLWRGAVAGINGMKPLTIKWNQVPGRTEAFKKQEIAKNGELKWRQEFECFQGDSMVHIQDEHGNIFAISVENLYLMLEQHGYTI